MYSEIKIFIPDNNLEERRFIIDTIFHEFLGVNYKIELFEELNNCIISFDNKKLILKEKFWNQNIEPLSYLKSENFPKVLYSTNQFIIERDIPILYGNGELSVSDSTIVCEIDVFASSYFMLTRWEEYINLERDNCNRFPGIASVAYKSNFLNRPIVNEYVEMIWNMLVYLGYLGIRKDRSFEAVLTHDVDVLKSINPLRTIIGDILKRKSLKLALSRIPLFINDPVNTFSFLMDVSESIGVKSHFYFMAVNDRVDKCDSNNYLNSRIFRRIIKQIRKRGHIIGFHPGYFTYNDQNQWKKEKDDLENALGFLIEEGRQHYLKLDISKTLRIWDEQKMKIDSTLSYADREGFRCGTGDSFHVFDFLNRQKLNLKESPLIVMDGSLKTYQNASAKEAKDVVEFYINIGKKYKMPITFLFHNSSFDKKNWPGWKEMYRNAFSNNKNK